MKLSATIDRVTERTKKLFVRADSFEEEKLLEAIRHAIEYGGSIRTSTRGERVTYRFGKRPRLSK